MKDLGFCPLTILKAIGGFAAATWFGLHPLVQSLIVLMALDIATGVCAGYVTRSLSSDVSFRGMTKKALMLLVVAAAHVIASTWSWDVPLGAVAAGFYCLHELISITENVARAGVPIPKALTEAIARLKEKEPVKAPAKGQRL